jgi:hypothetical protein
MPWIGGGAITQERKPVNATHSLEFPTTVSSRGIAPANAIVEHLTASNCRLRTVVFFDYGDAVEFEFGPPGEQVAVRGSVTSRNANGPRFVYQLRLDRMSAKEIDALATRVAGFQSRLAHARSHEETIHKLPTTERLVRDSFRVLARFDIAYRTPKTDFKPAKAGDVSMGGLLMICAEQLVRGEPVELRFTLPSDVLAVYPEETVAIDTLKGTAAPLRNDQHRPFAEMTVGARVVSNRPLANGLYGYGLAFTCIGGYEREEVARYTNAVQRSRNRH